MGSKFQKLLTSLTKNKVVRVLQPQSEQTDCGWIFPHKKALLRAMPIKGIVHFGWQFSRLAPTVRFCCPKGTPCVVVVHSCLQPRLIKHEWGASFFDVGANLKNYSCHLQRTKLCGSFGLRADKLLADLEQILPHKKAFLEGSAHPRVLSALGPKDPHGFVTCGKGTPLHV